MRKNVPTVHWIPRHRCHIPAAGAAVNPCPCTKVYRAYFASRDGLLAFRRMVAATNKRLVSIGYGENHSYYVRWACK